VGDKQLLLKKETNLGGKVPEREEDSLDSLTGTLSDTPIKKESPLGMVSSKRKAM